MSSQSAETLVDSSFNNTVNLGGVEVVSDCLDLSMVILERFGFEGPVIIVHIHHMHCTLKPTSSFNKEYPGNKYCRLGLISTHTCVLISCYTRW